MGQIGSAGEPMRGGRGLLSGSLLSVAAPFDFGASERVCPTSPAGAVAPKRRQSDLSGSGTVLSLPLLLPPRKLRGR